MADADEKSEQIEELITKAEGFMIDADFREDVETRQLRYLQAMSHALLSLAMQHQIMIDLLKGRGEGGAPSEG